MSLLEIRVKLLTIVPRILSMKRQAVEEILNAFPEARNRSMLLVLGARPGRDSVIDEEAGKIAFHVSVNGVREVDPENHPFSTTEMKMHVDTFLKIFRGEMDFRTAYLYDLIDVKSNDGLPAAYHVILWSAFWDRALEVVR
jgi:hypothetical protein